MAERCVEILAIPEDKPCLILDIGCGSGLSGSVLTEHGYNWIGVDISTSMLEVAKENEVEGDLINLDIGQGFNFRPGSFDYAISVSALQWLCIAEKKNYNVNHRLKCFFVSLYKCLAIGARCAFQFYPANPEQINIITKAALENGFTGGVVVDFPHSTKKKKYYLFLQAGFTKESIEDVMKAIPKNEIDVDHRIAKRLGGTDDLWNLQAMCKHCNRSKGKNSTNGEIVQTVATGAISGLISGGAEGAVVNLTRLGKSVAKQKVKDAFGIKYKR